MNREQRRAAAKDRRGAPAGTGATTTIDTPTIATTSVVTTIAPPARFALLVTTWHAEGHRRQRLLLSMQAAQRAREAALAKRRPVSITLVRLAAVDARERDLALAEVGAAGEVA